MGDTVAEFAARWQVKAVEKPERGHRRGQHADRTDHGLRGVPVIGHGSGAISDTAPGAELGAVDRLERSARELNEAARRIVRDRSRYVRTS